MTITNKGYGALGKGMTAFESRMDALRRIKEAVPGVFDKGTPPTKTGDTRTEKLGMGIMQSLPEGDETQTAFIPALGLAAGAGGIGVLGYLLQKQYDLQQKIRQNAKEMDKQRELLKPPEERSENMLPEEEQVAVNEDAPSLFPTERERERRLGEERFRKTLEDLRKQFEDYHLKHPSRGASSAPLSEYVIAKLQPKSVSQEGIAQLPALKGGGMMLFPY